VAARAQRRIQHATLAVAARDRAAVVLGGPRPEALGVSPMSARLAPAKPHRKPPRISGARRPPGRTGSRATLFVGFFASSLELQREKADGTLGELFATARVRADRLPSRLLGAPCNPLAKHGRLALPRAAPLLEERGAERPFAVEAASVGLCLGCDRCGPESGTGHIEPGTVVPHPPRVEEIPVDLEPLRARGCLLCVQGDQCSTLYITGGIEVALQQIDPKWRQPREE